MRNVNSKFWKDKNVFLTGHTGFKGGWLTLWLSELGANVYGFSLDPPTEPNFFNATKLKSRLKASFIGDIRDSDSLIKSVTIAKPDLVFHLAAQPIVRDSYQNPIETLSSNVLGTANLLEAVRKSSSVRAIVNVTSDKCYEDRGENIPYRETDSLGGSDPYSASKACAEIVANAYLLSFFSGSHQNLASARAGNVVGGGDWANERLIPDFFRALGSRQPIIIRHPNAIRPWQHVLEPLSGYLALAEKLFDAGQNFCGAWNFGPRDQDIRPVSWIVDYLMRRQPTAAFEINDIGNPYESSWLQIDSSKAHHKLDWSPRWNLEVALDMTLDWYQGWLEGSNMASLTEQQISDYCSS